MAFFNRHLQAQQQHQQQTNISRSIAPFDGQIAAPVSFFNQGNHADQGQPQLADAIGVGVGPPAAAQIGAGVQAALGRGPKLPAAIGLGVGPFSSVQMGIGGRDGLEIGGTRPREQELLDNCQASSMDFLKMRLMPSTGLVGKSLALSLAGASESTVESPMFLLPMFNEDASQEVRQMDAEMDQCIKAECENMRRSILEKYGAKQIQLLASIEGKILRKTQEKDSEIEIINRRNLALEEQIRQMTTEVGSWQQRAKYNESMVNALKRNLEQVYAHQTGENKEGCGDSEVDDTASCFPGGIVGLQLMPPKENSQMRDSVACKACRKKEACMLLLPCRHLCLCKECESKFSYCPLCQASKILGTEIYM